MIKKALPVLAACLMFLAACQPDPILTLDKESIEIDPAGGSQSVYVTSNYAWNAIIENETIKVSPSSGVENAYVSVSLPANNSGINRSFQVVFVCASKDMSSTKVLTVTQSCEAGAASVSDIEISDLKDGRIAAEGATITMTVTANASWTLRCDASDVSLDVDGGGEGTTLVKATVPACPEFEGRVLTFRLVCRTSSGGTEEEFSFEQAGGVVVYAGEAYHAAKMKDGKWWMTENLRYIPSGLSASDNASDVNSGVWYPLVINELTPDVASVKFSKEDSDIKANGYLYSTEVALGLKPGDITVDNAASFEGKRGICPDGWHIPSKADILGLVGKTADKNDTNESAPYYDAELNGGNGSVALLNADGFNANAWGAVSIANAAATKGSMIGAVKAYQKGMNTGYIAGSTVRQVTTNDDGSLKNVQYVAFMPNMNTGTFNGAWNNYRNGVSVRCVKD